MAATINIDELLAEYARLMAREPGAIGFTSEEWSAAWGCTLRTARQRLKDGIRAGVVHLAGYKHVSRMDGRPNQSPVYTIVKPSRKAKGR